MEKNSRVYAKINLGAIKENFRQMRAKLRPETKMIAVVKTDGYGHGAVQVARLAEPLDYMWGFAVATAEDALALRKAGIRKPVLILGFVFPEHYRDLAEYDIRPAVFKLSMAKELSQTAQKAGKTIHIHYALDTGMSRIGFADNDDSVESIKKIEQLPGLETEGLFTHFARADERDKQHARRQLQRYQAFAARLEAEGVHIPMKHCGNSAAIMELPEAHLDAVRAGITIYGIYPSDEMDRDRMRLVPAMELKSHIAYIKQVPEGVPVSYGGTYITQRPTRIATIPVGYGDGYPRSLSGKGYVLISGHRAPVLGRVCMDQFMVDVTDLEAEELQEVTLMGEDHGTVLGVDTLSRISGRFPYEFVCDIGRRVPRVYVEK